MYLPSASRPLVPSTTARVFGPDRLLPLPAHEDCAGLYDHVFDPQLGALATPDAGVDQQHQDRPVPAIFKAVAGAGGQQGLELGCARVTSSVNTR